MLSLTAEGLWGFLALARWPDEEKRKARNEKLGTSGRPSPLNTASSRSACVLFVTVAHASPPAGPAVDFAQAPLGPEGSAGPVGCTGCSGAKGSASALLPTSPSLFQAAKSIRKLVLDAVNLTRWFFWKTDRATCGVDVVTTEDAAVIECIGELESRSIKCDQLQQPSVELTTSRWTYGCVRQRTNF
jgi:hypothetical protein